MSYINASFIAFVKFTLFSTKMREFWPQIGPKNLSNFKLWWNGMPHPVDGLPDLVVHFEVENIDLEAGDTEPPLRVSSSQALPFRPGRPFGHQSFRDWKLINQSIPCLGNRQIRP